MPDIEIIAGVEYSVVSPPPASASNIGEVSYNVAPSGEPPHYIEFDGPASMTQVERVPVTIMIRDANGEFTIVNGETIFNLSSTNPEGAKFYPDADSNIPITSVALQDGDWKVTVYLEHWIAGNQTITATWANGPDGDLGSATLDIQVNFVTSVFLEGPAAVGENKIATLTLSLRGAYGEPRPVTGDTEFALATTEPAGGTFYSDSDGVNPVNSITIPTGQSTVNVYYRDTVLGNKILSATWVSGPDGDFGTAVHPIEVAQVSFSFLPSAPLSQIRLLDQNRQLLAIIDRVTSWSYTRRPSETTELSVTVPRFDEKLQYMKTAYLLQVYEGQKLRCGGRISKRDIGEDSVNFRAHTEEILLKRIRTPAQYGRVWDGWDLADVARDLLMGWHTDRRKDKTQWDAAIDKSNVDTSTEPGLVLLEKDGTGAYKPNGYIVLRFKSADIPGFERWDRIRWTSDNGDPVRTTMQYRFGPNEGSLGSWSSEIVGALPDELGFVPATVDAAILDVKINLYTDDVTSEDANGDPVGQTPAVFSVEVIARTGYEVFEGDIPDYAGVTVSGLTADNDTALKVLQDACSKVGWEFEVVDGMLNLSDKLGEDRRGQFVFRQGTNIDIEAMGDDDSEMVNILDAYGPGSGLNRLHIRVMDDASIEAYGPYPDKQEFEDAITLSELKDLAEEYVAEHNAPIETFRIRAVFPPEESPEFGVGDIVTIIIPDSGVVTSSRIMEERVSYGQNGYNVTLSMGRPFARMIDSILSEESTREVNTPPRIPVRMRSVIQGVAIDCPRPILPRWKLTEFHISATPGFTPGPDTLVDAGRITSVERTSLTPGERYYGLAVIEDEDGNRYISDERSAVAGHTTGKDLSGDLNPDGTISVDDVGIWRKKQEGSKQLIFQGAIVGEADDGDTVEFPEFETEPKIVLMPIAVATYDKDEAAGNQRLVVAPYNTRYENNIWKADIACRLVKEGELVNNAISAQIGLSQNYTSPESDPILESTTSIGISGRCYASLEAHHSFPGGCQVIWTYQIQVKKASDVSWGSPQTFTQSRWTSNPWITPYSQQVTSNFSHQIDLPSAGNWQIMITFTNISRSNNNWTLYPNYNIKLDGWKHSSDVLIQAGRALYIGLEGGD